MRKKKKPDLLATWHGRHCWGQEDRQRRKGKKKKITVHMLPPITLWNPSPLLIHQYVSSLESYFRLRSKKADPIPLLKEKKNLPCSLIQQKALTTSPPPVLLTCNTRITRPMWTNDMKCKSSNSTGAASSPVASCAVRRETTDWEPAKFTETPRCLLHKWV